MKRVFGPAACAAVVVLAITGLAGAQGDTDNDTPLVPESFGLKAVEMDPAAKLMEASLLQKVPAGGWVVLSTRTLEAVLLSLKRVEPEPQIGAFVKATAKLEQSRRFSQPQIELSTNAVEGAHEDIGRVSLAFARPLRIGSVSRICFRTKPDSPGGMSAYFEDLQPGTYYMECRFENQARCIGRLKSVWAEAPIKVYGYTEGKLTDKREDSFVEMPMLLVVEEPLKEWAFDVQLETEIGSVEFERLFIVKLL